MRTGQSHRSTGLQFLTVVRKRIMKNSPAALGFRMRWLKVIPAHVMTWADPAKVNAMVGSMFSAKCGREQRNLKWERRCDFIAWTPESELMRVFYGVRRDEFSVLD